MIHRFVWIAFLFLLLCISSEFERAFVVEVIDGDTLKLSNGELVRLLGINAPEKGQKFYEEAKERLRELVEGKTVLLEKDKVDRDRYGRLLRYVYVDDVFVNVLLVKEGLAYAHIVEKLKYEAKLREAEKIARDSNLGIWSLEMDCKNCIGIAYFQWDAEGDDCLNPNGEFVVFKNVCPHSCKLTSWKISDESGKVFVFPEFIAEGGKTFTI
ncbi:MAG: thermonuclease family protein, partial [Archaeoglobaceae archaeon]